MESDASLSALDGNHERRDGRVWIGPSGKFVGSLEFTAKKNRGGREGHQKTRQLPSGLNSDC